MKVKNWKSLPANLLAILISAAMFVPIYLLLVNSLKDEVQSRAMGVEPPTSIHWENYLTVIEQGKLGGAFLNSMLYATGATIVVVILSSAAAFVLSRNRSRRNRFLYIFITLGLAMPINYVTLTKIMQATGLINTVIGIICCMPPRSFLCGVSDLRLSRRYRRNSMRQPFSMGAALTLFFNIIFPLLTPRLGNDRYLKFFGFLERICPAIVFLTKLHKVAHDVGRLQFLWHV
jgi:raffinose/stachyose/melibiose transport system permease protein